MLGEDAGQHVAAGAVHAVDAKFETSAGNGIEIGEFRDGRDVGLLEVGGLNAGRLATRHRAQLCLDPLDDRLRGRAAKVRLEFHPVPLPGIVAGGDHHAARRAEVFHGVGERGRGRVVVGKADRNSSGGQHLRNRLGKAAGEKTRVVAYHQPLFRVLVFQHVRGNRHAGAAHVLEGKVVCDKAAPAVGAEFDVGGHLTCHPERCARRAEREPRDLGFTTRSDDTVHTRIPRRVLTRSLPLARSDTLGMTIQ